MRLDQAPVLERADRLLGDAAGDPRGQQVVHARDAAVPEHVLPHDGPVLLADVHVGSRPGGTAVDPAVVRAGRDPLDVAVAALDLARRRDRRGGEEEEERQRQDADQPARNGGEGDDGDGSRDDEEHVHVRRVSPVVEADQRQEREGVREGLRPDEAPDREGDQQSEWQADGDGGREERPGRVEA